MSLTYGNEMKDGWDAVFKKTEESTSSLGEVSSFLSKVHEAENSHGKSLQKISKVQFDKKGTKSYRKSKVMDYEDGTVKSMFTEFHEKLYESGNKHIEFSTNVLKLHEEIENWLKEAEKNRKKLINDAKEAKKEYDTALDKLKESRQVYERTCKEADNSIDSYLQFKNSKDAKEKDVRKKASSCKQLIEKADTADTAYKSTLQKTNQTQTSYYDQKMPHILKNFEEFERSRIVFLKSVFVKFMNLQNEFPNFVQSYTTSLQNVVDSIDSEQDIQIYLGKSKTGVVNPKEIDYQPYDNANPDFKTSRMSKQSSGQTLITDINTNSGPTISTKSSTSLSHSSISTFNPSSEPKESKDGNPSDLYPGLTNEISNLAFEDQKKHLDNQLNEIKGKIRTLIKTKKELQKLVSFYQNDPKAAGSAQQAVETQQNLIQKWKDQKAKILQDLQSISGEENVGEDDNEGEGGNVQESSPSTGGGAKAICLYDYDAANDTELSFRENDIVYVTEEDDSGWWYAELNGKMGFIPNNYVKKL
eukprot:TRINITY_DN4910_c0_g1_i1.p1 TRINITY_DN4910_c0_g1~~TRINITY_DN4910_c0_g1_i1.p1  ORF type:complete len:530 (+),score=149.46 TRINITY_DN4910_c0_g1_i1:100-1689(+)